MSFLNLIGSALQLVTKENLCSGSWFAYQVYWEGVFSYQSTVFNKVLEYDNKFANINSYSQYASQKLFIDYIEYLLSIDKSRVKEVIEKFEVNSIKEFFKSLANFGNNNDKKSLIMTLIQSTKAYEDLSVINQGVKDIIQQGYLPSLKNFSSSLSEVQSYSGYLRCTFGNPQFMDRLSMYKGAIGSAAINALKGYNDPDPLKIAFLLTKTLYDAGTTESRQQEGFRDAYQRFEASLNELHFVEEQTRQAIAAYAKEPFFKIFSMNPQLNA